VFRLGRVDLVNLQRITSIARIYQPLLVFFKGEELCVIEHVDMIELGILFVLLLFGQ
jgi:hypothetical protein